MRSQKIWKWLKCSVTFEGTGGIQQIFFNLCAENAVTIRNIKANETGFTAETSVMCYLKMHKLARKCRCKLKVISKTGWTFTFKNFRGRWGIPIGAAVFCVILFAFPSLLWSMRFYNFTQNEQNELRQSLYDNGIYEGCFITEEKLSRIKTIVAAQNDNYAHIALNLYRGRITAEKLDLIAAPPKRSKEPSNVIAVCDGIVEYWDKVNGFVHIKTGQSVVKGQVLIGGVGFGLMGIPYYVAAYGNVYAVVEQTYVVTQPLKIEMLIPCADAKYSYQIKGTGVDINLKNKNNYDNYKCTQSRYPLSVFGFELPFTVNETCLRKYDVQTISYTYKQACNIAVSRAYEALNKDFPYCSVIAHSETFEDTENDVKVNMKFTFRANIAKTVDFNYN